MSDQSEIPTSPEPRGAALDNKEERVVAAPDACRNHPSKTATCVCARCAAPICMTCTFEFPHIGSLCPSCATAKPEQMPPKRRRSRLISYLCAGGATIALLLIFGGAFAPSEITSASEEEAYYTMTGFAIFIFGLLPSIVGVSIGSSALNKRLGNPFSVIGAVVWNFAIIGIWLLLVVLGLISE